MAYRVASLLLAFLITTLLWGGILSAKDLVYENPHTYEYPFDKVWDGVVTLVQDEGFVIREIDKPNGYIAAEWQKLSGPIADIYNGTLVQGVSMYRHTFSVIPVNDSATTVHVRCATGAQDEFAKIEMQKWLSAEDLKEWEQGVLRSLDFSLITPPAFFMGMLLEYNEKAGRLKVMEMHPRSLARKSGIRLADLILKVGQNEVYNIKDYYKAMNKIAPGDTFTITVSRKKEEKTLSIVAPILPQEAME